MIARSFNQCLEQHYKAAVKMTPAFTSRTREEGRCLRASAILSNAIRSLTDDLGLNWKTIARTSDFGRPVEEGIDIVLQTWGGCPPQEHMCERVEEVVMLYGLSDAVHAHVAAKLKARNDELRERARLRAWRMRQTRSVAPGQAEVA